MLRPEPGASMRRREFIAFLGGTALATPGLARAQQARPYRVSYLALVAGKDSDIVKQRLADLGYGEGRNLVFDLYSRTGEKTACLNSRRT